MKQKFTVLFDLDGTLVDTAPDLMNAHNHVMKKFGYPTKSTDEIRNLVGKGAGAMIGRSIWGQAKKEFSRVTDQKIKDEMVKEFKKIKDQKIKIDNQEIKEIITVNGVRFSFEDGSWGLIRASSNKPSLVIVTESPTSDERKLNIFRFIDKTLMKTGKIGEYDQKI